MFAPVAETRLADRLVERAAKEMADGSPSHVIANCGVSVIEHLLGEKESYDTVEKVRNRRTRVLIALDLFLDLVGGLVHFRFTSC